MTSEEIKNKAFTGVIWSFINQFGTQILAIVPAMVLARLLSPSEYGLVAMASIFNGLAFTLSTGGFNDALMQKKDADHLDYCSVFYFNLFVNTFVYIVFFFLAPQCSVFFNEPLVSPVMRVSLLSLPLVAFGGVHSIILKRDLNFKAPALRNMVVQFVSAIVAVVMAFYGCGVWSLVVQGLLQTLGNSIFNYYLCSWRPTFSFSGARLKKMMPFGIKVYFTCLINYGFDKATDTTIAKAYSSADLSFYNRAYSTANIFIGSFIGVINNVAFPTFARMQGETKRLRNALVRFVSLSNMISFLLMALLFVLAEPLFVFLYSSKWNAVIPFFQIVCVWGLFQPVRNTIDGFLGAIGCAGIIMYNRILRGVLILVNIYFAWDLGITFMLWGQVCIEIISILVSTFFTNRFFSYGVLSIAKGCLSYIVPTFTAAIVASGVDYSMVHMFEILEFDNEMLSGLFRLLGAVSISISCFVAICRSLDINAYRDLIDMLSSIIGRKNPKVSMILEKLKKRN